jgi:acyl carrier protein
MSSPVMTRLLPVIVRAARLGPDERISGDTPMFGSGLSLDSVTALELLLAVEKEFGIELDPEALMAGNAMRTVGTFADFVGARTR